MASKILEVAKCVRTLTQKTPTATSLRRSLCTEAALSRSENATTEPKETLYSRISPLGNPSTSVVPVLDQWFNEDRKVTRQELRTIVRNLRSHNRCRQALEVSEWQSTKTPCRSTVSDIAIQLDLIGKIRGVEAAESFFNSLSDVEEKDMGKLHCTLLYCYSREHMVEKTLSLLQKMKDLGYATTFTYNNVMLLYKDLDQVDKIPDVLSEMKKELCLPDIHSYKICIEAYGTRSDLDNIELILDEMENIPHITPDWSTYSMVADAYIKASKREEALIFLKKCEELVGKDVKGYHLLISHHANLGHKDEMMRLWGVMKTIRTKLLNKDYITIIGMLAKLGEFEEAINIFKEWESSCMNYDFWVVNKLLRGYCQKGLTKKAESTLKEIIAKGKTPMPISWSIIATGYLDEKNMERAFECFKKALALQTESTKWIPEPTMIRAILDWLADSGDVDEVGAFMDLTKNVMPVNIEMYRALIRAYIRSGKEVDGVLERMKSDGIDMDEETEKIIKAQVV